MKKTKSRASTSLSPTRIVDEAIQLIEADGLERFSTRRLGERLGCEAMSIYHHFPSKGELLDAIASRLLGLCELPGPERGSPRQRLAIALRSAYDVARRYPGSAILYVTRRLNSVEAMNLLEWFFGIAEEMGFDTFMQVNQFRLMGQWINGVILTYLAATMKTEAPTRRVAASEIDVTRYPRVRQATPLLLPEHLDEHFDLLLEEVLDAVEAAPRRRPRAPKRGGGRSTA